jgi:hypothetical protein
MKAVCQRLVVAHDTATSSLGMSSLASLWVAVTAMFLCPIDLMSTRVPVPLAA